jgi:hypothetical protein
MKFAKNNNIVAFCCKFSILMINPGLKVHQAPYAWASGSLEINLHD